MFSDSSDISSAWLHLQSHPGQVSFESESESVCGLWEEAGPYLRERAQAQGGHASAPEGFAPAPS